MYNKILLNDFTNNRICTYFYFDNNRFSLIWNELFERQNINIFF